MATLTYAYADRAVVVGPLATLAEPHTYDLCAEHAGRLTPPRGWDIVRLSPDGYVVVADTDDLLAVVDAVMERPAARGATPPVQPRTTGPVGAAPVLGRARGHLRVLPGRGDDS